jgi:putative flippase GtrA
MGANLAIQKAVFQFGNTGALFVLALGAGTIVGLVVKYMLDKRWIFYDFASGVKNHSRKFTLYTAMGIVTTAMFWGAETAFWLIWRTDVMRELGAVIGLTIGYIVKYNLDRRFVFTDRQLGGAS